MATCWVYLLSQPSPSWVDPESRGSDYSADNGSRREQSSRRLLTQRLVFTAHVTLVTVALQHLEQEAVVQLPGAVGLVPVGDLGHLHVTWRR